MKKENFDLDNLGPDEETMNEDQFEMIQEQIKKIMSTLRDEDNQLSILKNKVFNILKKKPVYTATEI